MAGSVNKVILIGNLGRDPELRSTQDGMRIANLAVATSESWRDKVSGERKERTEWHRVVIFNERLAEIAEKYLRKGSKVYLEGALQTRKWTDNAGQERYTTEIVLNRFRGELTMLDGPGAPAAPAAGCRKSRAGMTRVMAAASATSPHRPLRLLRPERAHRSTISTTTSRSRARRTGAAERRGFRRTHQCGPIAARGEPDRNPARGRAPG